jgi:hypothetical protein
MGLGSLAVGAYAVVILAQALREPVRGEGGSLTSVSGALTLGSFVIFLACVISYYVWRKRQVTLRMLEEKIRAIEARIEEQEKRRAAGDPPRQVIPASCFSHGPENLATPDR